MARPEKETAVKEIADILEKATAVFVTDYQGLNVAKMTELRAKFREQDVGYRVVKNTLTRIAAKQVGYDEMVDYLEGPSALGYSFTDPSLPAKVIKDFSEEENKPVIKMTIFEGTFYGPDRVDEIAELPTKSELLTRLARGVNAPLQGFAGNLNALMSKFVRTLNAVKEKKEQQGE